MEEVAKRWLAKKVRSEIIGHCCDISNICGHRYPFREEMLNEDQFMSIGTKRDSIESRLSQITMLLHNFRDYVDPDTVIDDYFIEDKKKPKDKQNHWGTEAHIRDFKCFIEETKPLLREKRLNELV